MSQRVLTAACRAIRLLLRAGPAAVASYLVVGFCGSVQLPAQARTEVAGQVRLSGITHRVWTMVDGLPEGLILAIAQSSDGLLWLGTPHGLVRFDGIRFSEYRSGADSSLHEFGVSCLLLAQDGSMWAGSLGGGVTRFAGDSATHFGAELGLKTPVVRALFQGKDGSLLAGTDDGLYQFDGKSFVRKALRGESLSAIADDRRGGLWLAGRRFWHLSGHRADLVTLPTQRTRGAIRSLAQDDQGTLWIGAPDGLLRSADGVHFVAVNGISSSVRALHLDREGRLWIGTMGSGLLVKLPGGAPAQILELNDRNSKVVRAISSTQDGEVWIGFQSSLSRFSKTGMDLIKAEGNSGSVTCDAYGTIWFSTGALRAFRDGVEIKTALLVRQQNLRVRSFLRQKNGTIWIGTDGLGAYRLPAGGRREHFMANLGSDSVTGFLETKDGSVWIGTNAGVAHWTGGTLRSLRDVPGAPHGASIAMTETADGSVWIGTSNGLYHLVHGVFISSYVTQTLEHHRVSSLAAARDGSLWIGVESGLFDWRNGELVHVRLPHAPSPSDAIVSILEDSVGRILIAQSTIVFRFSAQHLIDALSERQPGTGGTSEVVLRAEPEVFPIAEEIGAELYGDLPFVAAADIKGGAWYASYQGLIHLGSDAVTQRRGPPPLTIQKVLVDGRRVAFHDGLQLAASVRNIEIDVLPIHLSSHAGLQLSRQLVGLEDSWHIVDSGTSSSYGKLAPGRYQFVVRARWLGQEAYSQAQMTIIQESAVYYRPWFLTLCGISVIALAWGLHRYQIHIMASRFQAVSDERGRLAREMHDTLLQGCLGVASVLDAIELSHEQAKSKDGAGISDRWRIVMHYAQQQLQGTILEARNAIWNLRNLDEETSLPDALREVLAKLARHSTVVQRFTIQGTAPILEQQSKYEVVMAAREAIYNALTHAEAKTISIHMDATMPLLSIVIHDDGKGFNIRPGTGLPISDHFGLTNIKERLLRIGGTATIASTPGSGTAVTLHVLAGSVSTHQKSGLG